MRPVVAVTILLGGGFALLAWLFLPLHAEFAAGAIAGMTAAVVVSVRDEPPDVIARWRRGAEGERATARAVRSLERKGWHIHHDLAARYGNIDHVVAGPGGVFLLDTKNVTGRPVVEDGELTVRFDRSPVNDYTLTKLARAVHGAAKEVRDRLHEHLGWTVDVYPVVVLVSERFDPPVVPAGRLTYVRVDHLASWLEKQKRRIADSDLDAVAAALATLPPAGDIPFERGDETA